MTRYKAKVTPPDLDQDLNPVWNDLALGGFVEASSELQAYHSSPEGVAKLIESVMTDHGYRQTCDPSGRDATGQVLDENGNAVISVNYVRKPIAKVEVGNRTIIIERSHSTTINGYAGHSFIIDCSKPLKGWDFLDWLAKNDGHTSGLEAAASMPTNGVVTTSIDIWFGEDSHIVIASLRWPELFDPANVSGVF